jgi:hypothetical protein
LFFCADTNVFISRLSLLDAIVSLLRHVPSAPVVFLVPVVVVRELDGLKTSQRMVPEPVDEDNDERRSSNSLETSIYASSSSTRNRKNKNKTVPLGVLVGKAIDWLRRNVNQSPVVRGQRRDESLAADILSRPLYPGVRFRCFIINRID